VCSSDLGMKKNIFVLPCCVESNFKKTPKNASEINFIYLGGVSKWQNLNVIISLYKSITQLYANTQLYIVTKQVSEIKKMLENEDLPNVKIKSMEHADVLEFLKVMDFGFLVREDVLFNNVASPIKFIEYISRGVIPIMSKGIGDYSSIVEKNKIGILLNENYTFDFELINMYLTDKESFNRLYHFSNDYIWTCALKDAALTQILLSKHF
jgi:glycosyltransferase involved in cell wall biosynthesis